MDTGNWRSQLSPGSRHKMVNKIMETLKKHLPFSGTEGINELRRIAARFEEKIFRNAVDQADYRRKISTKILEMDSKSRNGAGSSSSVPAVTHTLPSDPGHHMDNDNSKPALVKEESKPYLVKEEPVLNICDWRTLLLPDLRKMNANKIMETLKSNVPNVGQEGINELMKIATSFEELIFNTALNQVDYVRKISFKMMSM